MVGSTALDRSRDDLLRFLVRIFLCLAFDVLIQSRRIAACFLFYLLQYDLPRLFDGVSGDLLELLELPLQQSLHFLLLVGNAFFFISNVIS